MFIYMNNKNINLQKVKNIIYILTRDHAYDRYILNKKIKYNKELNKYITLSHNKIILEL